MKKLLLWVVVVLLVGVASFALYAAQNSGLQTIVQFESRESGFHSVFLQGNVPDEGCDLVDRAVIIETSIGAQTMTTVALEALENRNGVILRVDGCVPIDLGGVLTAPRVIKILIRA